MKKLISLGLLLLMVSAVSAEQVGVFAKPYNRKGIGEEKKFQRIDLKKWFATHHFVKKGVKK